jgi:hypothetical protein
LFPILPYRLLYIIIALLKFIDKKIQAKEKAPYPELDRALFGNVSIFGLLQDVMQRLPLAIQEALIAAKA